MKKYFSFSAYFNFLSRNKLFTFVNVIGFAVSLMFVILMGLYVFYELSVDNWHKNKDRIFWVQGYFSAPIANDLISRYPEIEQIIRTTSMDDMTIKDGANEAIVNAIGVDSNFFSIFDYQFISGNKESVLASVDYIVITRSFCQSFFGKVDDILGKSLIIDDHQFIVNGVIEDFDRTIFNSQIEVLYNFKAVPQLYENPDCLGLNSASWMLYVLQKENGDFASKEQDVIDYLKTYYWIYKDGHAKEFKLIPLKEVRFLRGDNVTPTPAGTTTTDKNILISLAITVLCIIFFAVINYINLSVAQAGFRAKEAATRRLIGGTKFQLFTGFMIESVFICSVSFVFGLLLAASTEGWFNELLKTNIKVSMLAYLPIMISIVLLIIILGIVSGYTPASVISSYEPIDIVKGTFRRHSRMVYSKVLITFQYVITIVLIGCTIIIFRQMKFMTSDVGYEHEGIVVMTNTMGNKIYGLRDILMTIPGVELVSFTQGTPGGEDTNNQTGKVGDNIFSFQVLGGDSLMLELFGIEIISETGIADNDAVYLNEYAFKKLELPEGVHEFKFYDNPTKIKGIIKDFHSDNMKMGISECMVTRMSGSSTPWFIAVKMSSKNQFDVYDKVKDAYLGYNGGMIFNSGFIDDMLNEQYAEQQQQLKIISVLALIAILLSSLGMFAMSIYFVTQRRKEVAVRKIMGSTQFKILLLLVNNFLRLIVVAFIIAVPIILYLTNIWLKEYVYRIDIGVFTIVIAGVVTLLIATMTVLWQSIKTANTNPVVALKKE